MGLWSSITGGVSELKNGISSGVHWVWDNAIISRTAKGGVRLAGQMLRQVAAIPAAIPKAMSLLRQSKDVELVKKDLNILNLPPVSTQDVRVLSKRIKEDIPEIADDAHSYAQWALSVLSKQETIQKIRSGMEHLVQKEILPAIGLSALIYRMQEDFGQEATTSVQYYFLWALTLINAGVTLYNVNQNPKIVTDVALLNSTAISAITANANKLPSAVCITEKCSVVNKFMDSQKEFLLLLSNDYLLKKLATIPYIGSSLALAGGVLSTGRYLNRVGNTSCEAHKGIQLGSALALGGLYKLTEWPLKSVENHLPWGIYTALTTLLLLGHVNIAANMELPFAEPDDLFTKLDPINFYEKVVGFMIDVSAMGLFQKLKSETNIPSYLSLSSILNRMTNTLENDYLASRKQFFSSSVLKQLFKNLFLARMFHSTDDFVQDKFIVLFWPELRAGVIGGINTVEEWHKSLKLLLKPVNKFSTPIAAGVRRQLDVPKPMTKILIKLANRKDVMQFLNALKIWFEQHNTKIDVALSAGSRIPLRGATAAFPLQKLGTSVPLLNEIEGDRPSDSDRENLDQYLAASVNLPATQALQMMDAFLATPDAQPDIVITTTGSAGISAADKASMEVSGEVIESSDGAELITPAANKPETVVVTPKAATAQPKAEAIADTPEANISISDAMVTTSEAVVAAPVASAALPQDVFLAPSDSSIAELDAFLAAGTTQSVDPDIDAFLATENTNVSAGTSPDGFFNTARQRRSPSLQDHKYGSDHKFG